MSLMRFVVVYDKCKPVRTYTEKMPRILYFDTREKGEEYRQSLSEPELFEVIDEVEMVKRRHEGTLELMKRNGD